MNVSWIKCQGDVWCKLNTVNLEHSHFENMRGVYIIWHGGPNSATVKVGKGNIKERLKKHRSDPEIQKYSENTLYVTWAQVDEFQMDGVEAYLGNKLNPKEGERFPYVEEIPVNFPW